MIALRKLGAFVVMKKNIRLCYNGGVNMTKAALMLLGWLGGMAITGMIVAVSAVIVGGRSDDE